jgi:perosamine synthetase
MRVVAAGGSNTHVLDTRAIVAAVRAVVPATATRVALHEPEFHGNEWVYVKECLDSGWVSSAGSYVDRFEAMLQDFTGAACAVATVNGTAALHVCLQLVGVQRGDEVLIPALTFIATANAVSYTGATPHFVDSETRTLGVDAVKLDAYLREIAEVHDDVCRNRRTGAVIRALVAMHTFGHPVDLDAVVALCARWRIALVEDAAESLGSWYRGRHTGTFGRVAGVSFNGNKIVTTGGGGAILTNDGEIGELAKHLTTTARVAHRWAFVHDRVGFNYRLPNLNAALGCAQMERLPDFLARKRRLAERYIEAFRGVAGVTVLREPPHCRSNYWLNVLLLDRPDRAALDAVLTALDDVGVMGRPVWTLMHRLPMYAACPRMDLSCAETLEQRIVNLPGSPFLAD